MKQIWITFFLSFSFLQIALAQCMSGDCKNGTGIYLYPSGAKYIGEFKDSEIHGIGVCYYTNGSKYQGQWQHRYPEGNGTLTLKDGSKWSGEWRRGHPVDKDGNIIANLFKDKEAEIEEGNIQVGCLSGDCKNGRGVFAYADGSKYEGDFVMGYLEGLGTFYFPDGDRYVGAFKGGYSHGKGVFYSTDGEVTEGEWKEGEYVGNPIIEDGREGCVDGNCDEGVGTYIYKDGAAKYVGEFNNSLPDGIGIVYYANGERYEGNWKDGYFEGLGTLWTMNGNEVRGLWKEGVFQGKINKKPETTGSSITITRDDASEEVLNTEPLAENQTEEDVEGDKAESNENPAGEESTKGQADSKPATYTDYQRTIQGMKVWAVIVGIGYYNHMPALRYTKDDAYLVYSHFKSPEGGALTDDQIKILVDEAATLENIEHTIKDIFSKAGPNDLVMLYFSGHGLKGAFLPIDFDGYNNKLPHETINRLFEESPAKYKLLVADACHSGSLLALKSGEMTNPLAQFYSNLAQAKGGTALLMSSKSDETSLESSGLRQGVFSHFLIRGLKGESDTNGNKIVTIQELYDFINQNVRTYTANRQTPLIRGDYDQNMPVSVVR